MMMMNDYSIYDLSLSIATLRLFLSNNKGGTLLVDNRK